MTKSDKIESIKKGKPFRIFDVFFLAGLAAAVLLLCWWVYWSPPPYAAEGVEVWQIGEKIGLYPFSKVKGKEEKILLDGGALTLVIEKNGACYVEKGSSDCPDHACERMGTIRRVNQKIVCAPNGIVIRLVGESGMVYSY